MGALLSISGSETHEGLTHVARGVVVKFHRDSLYVVKLTKLDVALTLSYLMDLWLHRKFCPSFEVRRSGGEEERFASGVCSCVMVCYWEFFPALWEKNNSLVSLNL